MKHELSLKQKQKLILTPQLYQAIHILQLNIVELRNLINQELIYKIFRLESNISFKHY